MDISVTSSGMPMTIHAFQSLRNGLEEVKAREKHRSKPEKKHKAKRYKQKLNSPINKSLIRKKK